MRYLVKADAMCTDDAGALISLLEDGKDLVENMYVSWGEDIEEPEKMSWEKLLWMLKSASKMRYDQYGRKSVV